MSRTRILGKNQNLLWAISAGRCQFRGCNKALYIDILTKKKYNQAYIAHIVADSPEGPRGDVIRSPLLANEISNLMLMCDTHHRLIDQEAVAEHTEELLREMKKEHEDRISITSSIGVEMSSHIVIYRANVGENSPQIDYSLASKYLLPHHYPAKEEAIELGLVNCPGRDKDSYFWESEKNSLMKNFQDLLLPKLRMNEIRHISLFAFAPMPLLVKLGTLLNDINNITIHQPTREPVSWNLSDENLDLRVKFNKTEKKSACVALNISLSARIDDSRIRQIVGEDSDIFTITIDNPNNDFLKSKSQLSQFRLVMRQVFYHITTTYGSKTCLNIFPAMPVGTAIELGRVWMPKADLPLRIYDQNSVNDGFSLAIEIK